MTIERELTLRQSRFGPMYIDNDNDPVLCHNGLLEYVDLPVLHPQIWIVATKKRVPHSFTMGAGGIIKEVTRHSLFLDMEIFIGEARRAGYRFVHVEYIP